MGSLKLKFLFELVLLACLAKRTLTENIDGELAAAGANLTILRTRMVSSWVSSSSARGTSDVYGAALSR